MVVCQYGDYDFVPAALIPEARLALTINPAELTTHWRRCSLLSDFIGGYIASAFSLGTKMRESDVFNSVSTIFQELIENAAKFSPARDASIAIELCHYDRLIAVEIKNDATSTAAKEFERYVQGILASEDLDGMYRDILERHRVTESRSGIGLLLLVKDYGLKFGVRFSEGEAERTTVTVRAFYFIGDE